jgi:uncharacterized membrane protein required for colicin V production
MIGLDVIFWVFIILFGLIGMMRGWAKELLVTFSVILALFIITVLIKFVPFLSEMARESSQNVVSDQTKFTLFWLRTGLLLVLAFFGYQTPSIPRLAGSGRFARDRLQDSLLGLFLGAVNGYLVWGCFWFFLNQAGYPFKDLVSSPTTESAKALISFLPPQWLLGEPVVYFAVAVAFAFVLVVFL